MRNSGFSLVELVVSLALISIVFLAALPLITDSVRAFELAGKNLRNPELVLFTAWLRRDIHSAATVAVDPKGKERLDITMFGGTLISYRVEKNRLFRLRFSPSGTLLNRHLVMSRLDGLHWTLFHDLVLVVIKFPVHTDPLRARLNGKQTDHRSASFCFGLRGRGASW